MLFLTFSVLVASPKNLLNTVADLARGLMDREKITKKKVKVWHRTPQPLYLSWLQRWTFKPRMLVSITTISGWTLGPNDQTLTERVIRRDLLS